MVRQSLSLAKKLLELSGHDLKIDLMEKIEWERGGIFGGGGKL
jgi:hypothetical protein